MGSFCCSHQEDSARTCSHHGSTEHKTDCTVLKTSTPQYAVSSLVQKYSFSGLIIVLSRNFIFHPLLFMILYFRSLVKSILLGFLSFILLECYFSSTVFHSGYTIWINIFFEHLPSVTKRDLRNPCFHGVCMRGYTDNIYAHRSCLHGDKIDLRCE